MWYAPMQRGMRGIDMKRSLIPMLVAVLAAYGCSDSNDDHGNKCGDGILGPNEICDGTLFTPGLKAFCPNGDVANNVLVRCTPSCTLDLSMACAPANTAVCGNGIVEGNETCDGSIPPIVAGCDNPDYSKLSCKNCRLIDDGVCPKTSSNGTCGNGIVEDGELCDGDDIPAAARVCPENMVMSPNPLFQCSSTCQIVDVSKACTFGLPAVCGNARLDDGEACDGELFDDEAVKAIDCGTGKELNEARLLCSNTCKLDTSMACTEVPYEGVLFSELVPYIDDRELKGIAIEVANRGKESIDLSSCSLALFSESKIEKKFPFTSLNLPKIDGKQVYVVCSAQDDTDRWGNTCNYIVPNNEITANIANKTLMGIVCDETGDDGKKTEKYVDFVNLNSFIEGANKGATDFIRLCKAHPHTEPKNALMGEGWSVTAYEVDKPRYNLGIHCPAETLNEKISCKFSISPTTITSRKQTVDMALEFKIPGITDKTEKTDPYGGMSIEFYSGSIDKNGKVNRFVNHYVKPAPDMEWKNPDGYDRYIGSLRNFETYEGFWRDEQGTYTVDACVSFDNGETCTYCGPNGVVLDYETYHSHERETLTVTYAENNCGDGVIEDGEVCDGDNFLPESLICDKEGQIILNPNKVSCGSCNITSTGTACGDPLPNCNGQKVDAGEVCDGTNIPQDARVCPEGQTVVDNPQWICGDTCAYVDTSKACEVACGNGKIDAVVSGMNAEICDGDDIPEAARVCPTGMVLKDNPVWVCNSACSGIDATRACEVACGNGKIDAVVSGSDTGEVCDGNLFTADIASKCNETTTYDETRKSCNSQCKLDHAACVPNAHLVFDEYAFVSKPDSNAEAFAMTINLYGNSSFDASGCTLSFLDANAKFIYNKYTSGTESGYRLARFDLLSMGQSRVPDSGNDKGKLILNPCEPLVICSIPSDEATYKYFQDTVFDNKCDASLVLESSPTTFNGDFVVKRMNDIAYVQLTCGGNYIDYIDFKGLVKDYKAKKTHGKIKASDKRPWSSYETVVHANRFDTDDAFNIATFATPVCK